MLNHQERLDLAFHALSVPARRSMIDRLSLCPLSVKELAGPLHMSLPAVIQHLQVLEASGLVRSEKQGRTRRCRLEPKAFLPIEQWVAKRRTQWENKLDRLAKALGE
jgi:DNA-binding transcriptional ArsR family regulator